MAEEPCTRRRWPMLRPRRPRTARPATSRARPARTTSPSRRTGRAGRRRERGSVRLPLLLRPLPSPLASQRLPGPAANLSATAMARILIVEDKDSLRTMLEEMLKAEGLTVTGIGSGAQAVERLRAGEKVDLVLTDWRLPGADGLAVLDAAIARDPTLPVLMMTAFGSIETAVEAMKHGAEDFITKPVDPDLLRLLVRRAIERRAQSRASLLFAEASSKTLPPIVGESAAIRAVRADVERVAATDATVLLEGESGTGKELFARAIHELSARRAGAFVAINCAAIPETLLESELFGHERGSFTGASARRMGKFELADGGSIFLDEIGELSPA